MAGVRFSLFSKIMLWFFLNLLLLGGVLLFVFNMDMRFSPHSQIFGGSSNRMESISHSITDEILGKDRAERDEILKRYSETYKVEFFIFDEGGKQVAGRETDLPSEVVNELKGMRRPPPPGFPRENPGNLRPNMPPPPSRLGPPFFFTYTLNPSLYWSGSPIFFFEKEEGEPVRARLIVASDSFFGNGLFFNPTPWLIIISVIVAVSTLFWLPFVRNLTKTIGQMKNAAEQIAEEDFDVRVSEKRTDELGTLGTGINHLANRLSGFVNGQRRFLGDISHELNSPLARMQFALSILEDRVDEDNRLYVEDVKEEVELMSKLVSELLEYSKAGIKARDVELKRMPLAPLVNRVVERETTAEKVDIKIDIAENLTVMAQDELLSRALANVVRNAVRYAGSAGTIHISAEEIDGQVKIIIADKGAGVPEAGLEKLFDPFYRIESDRSRQTGGTGLGLAIVKTCVEACQGKVSAENLSPKGFAVNILLKN